MKEEFVRGNEKKIVNITKDGELIVSLQIKGELIGKQIIMNGYKLEDEEK